MSAGLSENELSDSYGLSSISEGEMNTSEEKGDSIEDEDGSHSFYSS